MMFRGSKPQDELSHRSAAASSTQSGGREASHSTSAASKICQLHIDLKPHDFPSGLYFYQLRTGEQTLTRRMMLVK
jgi:hypothetical protein